MITSSRRDLSLLLVAALLIATFGLYYSALESMASVWFKSDAFVYGVLILPMSVYMIWQKRAIWTRVPAKPALTGIVLLSLCLLAWVAASLVSVQLGSQLAFILAHEVLENFILAKPDQPEWEKDDSWMDEFELD